MGSDAMVTYKSDFISCDFDFDEQGKNYGAARLIYSDNANAGRVMLIPIVTMVNGNGPTVLLAGGNHGNEDEGPLILRRLIHELEPSDVQGRIIFLPALNYPAVRAWTRTSPLDNGNLNRSFPGDGTSGPTRAIARFVVDAVLPLTDAGIDLHSGGHTANFAITSFLCTCADTALYRKSAELADAFKAPYMYVVSGINSPTGFDPAAHAQDIPFISTELGGGGIDREAIRFGYRGVRNVLAHLNVIAAPETAAAPEKTIYLDGVNGSGGVLAPFEGMFEAQFDIGDNVKDGQTAGVLYSLDEVDRPPKELLFTDSGIVCVKNIGARVLHGTRICVTAKSIAHNEMLALVED